MTPVDSDSMLKNLFDHAVSKNSVWIGVMLFKVSKMVFVMLLLLIISFKLSFLLHFGKLCCEFLTMKQLVMLGLEGWKVWCIEGSQNLSDHCRDWPKGAYCSSAVYSVRVYPILAFDCGLHGSFAWHWFCEHAEGSKWQWCGLNQVNPNLVLLVEACDIHL